MLQGDWWDNDIGTNLLKGVDGSTDNPPCLEDEAIVEFLVRIPASRAAFLRMVGNMLPAEQTRLMGLYSCAVPPPSTLMDPNSQSDSFQHRMNSGPVRTSGPRGGGSWAPR
jgi:hypothetical protein